MAAATPVLVFTLLSLALCAVATIPAEIQVPQGNPCKVQQTLHARGYQYYRYNGTAWENSNATARLYNSKKEQVGQHFYLPKPDAQGGKPTWKTSGKVPHSRVTCKPVSGVTVDHGSIPWVLLESTQSQGDETYFGAVAFVQRINTKLGLGPKTTTGAREGDVKKSPYTADYLFYVPETNY